MSTLNDHESEQVREISRWKSERPSLLLESYRSLIQPFSKLVARFVPETLVAKALERVEALSEVHDFAADIREASGIAAIPDLLNRPLEECDRLSKMVSVRAEHLALLEGVVPASTGAAVPGLGGVAAVVDVPFLLEATIRAVRRIGHCYGFALDTEADRRFVLEVLNIASREIPAGVEEESRGLWNPDGPTGRDTNGSGASGAVEESLADDLPIEFVPVAGDIANLVLDYAFVRRADLTARRIFQERWLRANGKVESILPSPDVRRRSSVEGIVAVASEVAYVGAYGVSFGVTFPATLAGLAVQSVAPASVLRGVRDGASAATRDSRDFLEGFGQVRESPSKGSLVPAGA